MVKTLLKSATLEALKTPVVVGVDDNLISILNSFQDVKPTVKVALIAKDPVKIREALKSGSPIPEKARPTHFCSMEDVVENILKEDIVDEADVNRQLTKNLTGHTTGALPLGRAGTLERTRSVLASPTLVARGQYMKGASARAAANRNASFSGYSTRERSLASSITLETDQESDTSSSTE